jgi:hypothetical protein
VTRIVVILAAVVFATGFVAWRVWFRDTTTPIGVADAVERFQDSRPDDGSPTAGDSLPEPGVYVYQTVGSEQVDALNGARHRYPLLTTITVEHHDCGFRLRWQPIEERHEAWTLCRRDSELVLVEYETFHRFFGQNTLLTYLCDAPAVLVADPSGPPGPRDATCTTGNEVQTLTISDQPTEALVDGEPVGAVEVRIEAALEAVDNNVSGARTIEIDLHAETGLVLSWRVDDGSVADSPVGKVKFSESFELSLVSLSPSS